MPASVLLSSEHKLEVSLRTLTSADSNGVRLSVRWPWVTQNPGFKVKSNIS